MTTYDYVQTPNGEIYAVEWDDSDSMRRYLGPLRPEQATWDALRGGGGWESGPEWVEIESPGLGDSLPGSFILTEPYPGDTGAAADRPEPRPDAPMLVLEISGGVLQAVHSDEDLRVVLLDWDDLGDSPDPKPESGEAEGNPGRYPLNRMADMADTTREFLEKAGLL